MKHLARAIFNWLARMAIKKYHPLVVGVGGSVGKTATKDAIAVALGHEKRSVRKTEGSFNAEIGVPVTIIAGGWARNSLFGWLGVMWRGIVMLIWKQVYPKILVLEMGSDKPGDLSALLKVVRPNIGVLTSTAPEHLEFFGDEASVIAEETLMVRTLSPENWAVINIDDERNRAVIPQLPCRVKTYGWQESADVRAESMSVTSNEHGGPTGMVIKIAAEGNVVPVALPGMIGRHQALPVLAAIAVTMAAGDSLAQAISRLSGYQSPPGRMRLLTGLHEAVIIDDSYNASPEAVQAALMTLADVNVPGKKYIILGQMSELGASANEWHDNVGRSIGPKMACQLITVGPLAKRFGEAAVSVGFPSSRVTNVENAEAAAALLQNQLGPGDLVLIKGSRYAARLERAVKILLADPMRDAHLLVGRGKN